MDILLAFYFLFDLPADLLEEPVMFITQTAAAAVHNLPTTITCDTDGVCSGGWIQAEQSHYLYIYKDTLASASFYH